ncbi:hypothetical protein CCR75_009426 [Bremia lactucae]|uniref:Uncharacterized protein n=1 Tax=Bremia lactucae TaxID=4779 RepID=A0A976NZX3_BRELC|nr:hypothetical protein CCR75_009426 [Bremia lactucae]
MVDRYKDYLNKAFYFPEGRKKSPGTSRIEKNSDGPAFSNLYSRKVLQVLATAIINIDNFEKLASLASGPVYRRALELLPEYKDMMSKYPVEQWPQDIILQRLLDVH